MTDAALEVLSDGRPEELVAQLRKDIEKYGFVDPNKVFTTFIVVDAGNGAYVYFQGTVGLYKQGEQIALYSSR